MNWQVFLTTFVTIFLAELGDKTQFAAVAASASAGDSATREVLLAVVLALATAGTMGVIAGKYLATLINPTYMRYLSGGLFIVCGLWVLVKSN